jgi:serine/threonine protein kinase
MPQNKSAPDASEPQGCCKPLRPADWNLHRAQVPGLSEAAIKRSIPGVSRVSAPLQGGQKMVFPCFLDGNRCALMIMLAGADRTPTPKGAQISPAEARALREVDIMHRCRSPHLAAPGPIDATVAEIDGRRVVYFTEEWIDGDDLRTILHRRGPLPFADVVHLGIDIAQAIDALWSERIVHRDVKPSNIMRRSDSGAFVLLDLGSALDLSARALADPNGRMPGTRAYFSPERAHAPGSYCIDCRSDLFSLGIVLYEATTGVHPFASPAVNDVDVLTRIQQFQPLRPSSLRAHVPFALSAIIMRLLAKSPARRYATCSQLVDALEACCAAQA